MEPAALDRSTVALATIGNSFLSELYELVAARSGGLLSDGASQNGVPWGQRSSAVGGHPATRRKHLLRLGKLVRGVRMRSAQQARSAPHKFRLECLGPLPYSVETWWPVRT
jgi:hypothetical protein